MLQIVLLVGKIAFLIILYLFIYRVVRSTTASCAWRPRARQAASGPPWWGPIARRGATGAGTTSPAPGRGGVWTLVVQKSPCMPRARSSLPGGAQALGRPLL